MEGASEKVELEMDVKVVSGASEGFMMILFGFGVFFALSASIVLIVGLMENNPDSIIGGFVLVSGAIFIVLFFPYRNGKILGYEDTITIPSQGFGIFRGKAKEVRYENIREVCVRFRYPRTDRIRSMYVDGRPSVIVKLFGRPQSKYERLLRFFDQKRVRIRPDNWDSRRLITWKDRHMLVSYVLIPLLFIAAITVLLAASRYLATWTVSFAVTLSILFVILFAALYSRKRLALEGRYRK